MPRAQRSGLMSVKKLALHITRAAVLATATAAAANAIGAQQARPPAEPFPAELDRYIAKALVDGQIPGLAIAIVRNDSTLVAKGYGVRELGRSAPVDQHTVFDIASLGKSFTATAIAILVDRGRIHWDDPVRKYLPALELPTPDLTATATVRDFLSHRTGLPAANLMWMLSDVDRREVLRRFRHLPVAAPARQSMIYSNIGYSVAGEAAAAAASTTYEALVRDLVIKPLGLSSSTWSYEQADGMPNVSSSHARIAGKQQTIPRERQRQAIAPAAAVQSSVHDLARWLRLHLNNGVLDGTRYVSDSAMRAMHSIQVPIATTPAMRAARNVEDSVVGYGLGWQKMDYRGHPLVWHTGSGNGQYAYMALLPRDRLGVVVIVNTWAAGRIEGAIASRVIDTYLGYPARDWVGETLTRIPDAVRAHDSAARAMAAMKSAGAPPLRLDAYAGRYDHPGYGPFVVRLAGSRLSLQWGGGQAGDLEYHGGNAFHVQWRDPFFREFFPTHVYFDGTGALVTSLRMQINREEFRALKAG